MLLLAAGLLAGDDTAELERRLAAASGPERVEILLDLSKANMYRAPERVVSYAQQAYEEATALALPRRAAQALVNRGIGYFQAGDLDRALESYREGMREGEKLDDHALMGACLNGVAAVNMKRGMPDAALEHFNEAVMHLQHSDDLEKLAGVYNNISLIHYAKGQYDQALDFMAKALHLYEELGNVNGQGIVLNAIGNVYNKLDDPTRAREHFERALAIAEQTDHKQLITSCLVNIAEIQISAKAWEPALDHLQRALGVARQLGSKEYISICLNNIGDVLRERGEIEEALAHYLESMRLFEEMHARPRLGVSYVNIGRLYKQTGRLAEGEEYLLKGYELAGEVEERNVQKEAAEALYGLYEEKGDYRRAYEFQREFSRLKEQMFSRENYEKIATLQSKLEAEKKQREIEVLKKEGEITELRVKRQRLWLVFIASGGLLLGSLAVVLYGRYRLKVRTNTELSSAYSQMAELARHDPLTGLLNRRSALELIEMEMVRIARSRRVFSVIIIDVDDFKHVNDTHGHECGDRVLLNLSDVLRGCVREQDVAARWGGEEFLLMLPETSSDGAAVAAEKVRAAAEAARVRCASAEIACTVTLGVTTCERVELVAACIRRADDALYEGKRAGKNRVVVAS